MCSEGRAGIQINSGLINVTTLLLCFQGIQEMGDVGVHVRETGERGWETNFSDAW